MWSRLQPEFSFNWLQKTPRGKYHFCDQVEELSAGALAFVYTRQFILGRNPTNIMNAEKSLTGESLLSARGFTQQT